MTPPPEIRFLLSHPLGEDTPAFLDNPPVKLRTYSTIDDLGANQVMIEMLNHSGTHIDASAHFDRTGRTLTDYESTSWMFTAPRVVDIPKTDGELIHGAELKTLRDTWTESDLVIFRTGFQRVRDDRERFGGRAPGFAADAASVLRSLPGLRAIGMDLPSASSPLHLDEGFGFHREVLSDVEAQSGTKGILLIEDMRLDHDLSNIKWVVVAPLLIEQGDGGPVTIFAG